MRVWFSIAAFALALVALIVSVLDNAQEGLAFFLVAGIVALSQAVAVRQPYEGARRKAAKSIAAIWVLASIWIGVLLVMYQSASRAAPGPEATYLGLTATVYHLIALYGGAVLVTAAAFLPRGADVTPVAATRGGVSNSS